MSTALFAAMGLTTLLFALEIAHAKQCRRRLIERDVLALLREHGEAPLHVLATHIVTCAPRELHDHLVYFERAGLVRRADRSGAPHWSLTDAGARQLEAQPKP